MTLSKYHKFKYIKNNLEHGKGIKKWINGNKYDGINNILIYLQYLINSLKFLFFEGFWKVYLIINCY